MNPIEEILDKPHCREVLRKRIAEAAAQPEGVCRECQGRGWILTDGVGVGEARRCSCRSQILGDVGVKSALTAAGLTPREISEAAEPWRGRSGYDAETWQALTVGLVQWAAGLEGQGMAADPWAWVLEGGSHPANPSGVGVGKSRALHVALSTVARRRGAVGLLRCRTDLAAAAAERYQTGKSISSLEDRWMRCRLLAVDDLGTEKDSETHRAALLMVLEWRYQGGAPTVVSLNPGGIRDARLESRLRENSRWLEVAAPDFRKVGAKGSVQ